MKSESQSPADAAPPGRKAKPRAKAKQANHRTEDQREVCRRDAAKLYCKGWTLADISKWLGETHGIRISVTQVSLDLKYVREQWRKEYAADVHDLRLRELQRIDHLESTYWEGYERSLRAREKKQKERKTAPPAGKPKGMPSVLHERMQVTTEETDGNTRWLEGIRWCIEQRCRLLGVNAPTRVELAGSEGGPIKVEDGGLSDDALQRAMEVLKERVLAEATPNGTTQPAGSS